MSTSNVKCTIDKLFDIIEHNRTKKILIFGPPRSGTTLTSFILAKELNLPLVPEDLGNRLGMNGVDEYMKNNDCIIHANNAILYFHKVPSSIMTVMLVRSSSDCIKSAKKADIYAGVEKHYEELIDGNNYVERYNNFWQVNATENSYLLNYNSLASTKYWVPKTKRGHFKVKQVSLDKCIILDEFDDKYFRKYFKFLSTSDKKVYSRR